MIASWPCLAAVIAGWMLRQAITVAPGASPPSRISSQPTRRRPRAASQVPICLTNQLCSSSSLSRPRVRMRAWAAALCLHSSLGTSSPPMWMNVDGNIASTSVSTSCRNASVRSSGLNTCLKMPQVVATSSGWPVLPNSG